ncbi:hypothetical protein [Rhodococcus erythropolis]|uniref:hypothetical protein n=1 Tax=Rhodococcus erythropolis TaxID=1833 RepID=UPI00366EA64F
MTTPLSLPCIDARTVAAAIAALPTRLQKRADAVIATRNDWLLSTTDTGVRVHLAGEVTVELAVAANQVETAVCTCLLSPRCAHRAAVLSACPPAEQQDSAESDPIPPDAETTVSAAHRAAARSLWDAAANLIENGCAAAGAAERALLLRAVHTARAVGLHRGARSGAELAEQLRRYGERSAEFSLTGLHQGAVETLLACHLVQSQTTLSSAEIGRARRRYEPVGGLRLFGLISEPVVTASGYAGVVTWMVDSSGVRYSMSDVQPGGVERCVSDLPVALVGSGIDHRRLAQRGLTLSGATATESGRLGRGVTVSAVPGAHVDQAWTSVAVRRLFDVPVREQVAAALTDSDGDEGRLGLICCDVEVSSATVHSVQVMSEGLPIELAVPPGVPGLLYAQNLRQLGRVPGARMRLVGRIAADRPGQLVALAIRPRRRSAVGDIRNLAWDPVTHAELSDSVEVDAVHPIWERGVETTCIQAPLMRASDRLHQVLRGGRRMARGPVCLRDVDWLRESAMPNLAQSFAELFSAAKSSERDEFGRRALLHGERFTIAWLRAAVMVTASRARSQRESWGLGEPHEW